jgi:hypothetical protein
LDGCGGGVQTQFGGMDKEQYTAFIIRKQQKREKEAQRRHVM